MLVVLAAALSCSGPRQDASTALQLLFEQDQAERSGPIEQADLTTMEIADSARRERVRALAARGALLSADDHYHAAMIFQHGRDSAAYHQAHVWAQRAEQLDSTQLRIRWLVAATWDRYQMSRGQPQWFGTQTTRLKAGHGSVVLYTMDRTRVTDEERERRGVGRLWELCARLDSLNRRIGQPVVGCLTSASSTIVSGEGF
jgi:hypothetical protein